MKSNSNRNEILAHVCALCAFILFGSTVLIVKNTQIAVIDLIFGRMAITAAILVPISLVLYRKNAEEKASRMTYAALFATGAAIFLNMICLYNSFRLASPTLCIALFYSGPVLTTFLLAKIDKRSLQKSEILTSTLIVLGILGYFAYNWNSQILSQSEFFGYGLALLGGVLFGLIPVFERQCKTVSPFRALGLQSLFAAICLYPATSSAISMIVADSLWVFLILGVFLTLIPFMLWWSSTRLSNSVSPFVAYVDPLTTMLMSVFILGEKLVLNSQLALTVLLGGCSIYALFSRLKQLHEVKNA